MAEIVGLAASIVQLGGAGVELSIKLHNFVKSATNANKEVVDLIEDLDSTGSALDHVGTTLRARHMRALASPQASNVAAKIIARCELIFTEVEELIQKRMKADKHGNEMLTFSGKLGWPLKEKQVELVRRRLDSLKLSLSLLFSTIKLAQEESQEVSRIDHAKKRETIRVLCKQQARAVKREMELEAELQSIKTAATRSPKGLSQRGSQAFQPFHIAAHVSTEHPQAVTNASAARILSGGNRGTYNERKRAVNASICPLPTGGGSLALKKPLEPNFPSKEATRVRREQHYSDDTDDRAPSVRKRKGEAEAEKLHLSSTKGAGNSSAASNNENEESIISKKRRLGSDTEPPESSLAMDLFGKEWVSFVEGLPSDEGRFGKDIVDALLEQWTVPFAAHDLV
ncbi:hypothetical protein E8E12_005903 [Didymella heteroderae]|uniref:Fungal N-terminal domain-containing protein n=1 Tax=Didymella heteroderae TaxID=1769908 RepID=A0A9P4WMR0_9PLEO|nr:hypothetical protein E8E12_005903 [Didymella heteroderae]